MNDKISPEAIQSLLTVYAQAKGALTYMAEKNLVVGEAGMQAWVNGLRETVSNTMRILENPNALDN